MSTPTPDQGITVDELARGARYLQAMGMGGLPVVILYNPDGRPHALASGVRTGDGWHRAMYCLETGMRMPPADPEITKA